VESLLRGVKAKHNLPEQPSTAFIAPRLGKPDEIAEAVFWLCSEASSFVSGTTLTLDGAVPLHLSQNLAELKK